MQSDEVLKPPAALIALVPRPRKSSSAGHPGELGNGAIAAGAVFPHLPGRQPAGALGVHSTTMLLTVLERRECNRARSSADAKRADQGCCCFSGHVPDICRKKFNAYRIVRCPDCRARSGCKLTSGTVGDFRSKGVTILFREKKRIIERGPGCFPVNGTVLPSERWVCFPQHALTTPSDPAELVKVVNWPGFF